MTASHLAYSSLNSTRKGGDRGLQFLLAFSIVLVVIGSSLGSALANSSKPGAPGRPPAFVPPAAPNASYQWTNISGNQSSAPSPRWGAQVAYSPPLGHVVLFGGYNVTVNPDGDTWAFIADHWQRSAPVLSPPPRWAGTMVYDAADGYLLMFGGRNDTRYFNDTWEYTATGWHPVVTGMAPSPRSGAGMAYDSRTGQVVLYGGGMGNVPAGSGSPWVFFNDTWTYSAGVWANVTRAVGTPPSARGVEGMTFDGANGRIVLHGGGNGNPPCPMWYGDTWRFSGGGWVNVTTASAPPPSDYGGLLYNAVDRSTLLYQGASYNPSCITYSSEVWTYSPNNWNLSVPASASSPPGRGGATWVDDPADNVEILFGGSGASSYLNDTWLLRTNLTVAPQVSPDRLSADVGQTTVFSAGVFFGGWPPYSNSWQGLPSGCAGTTTPTVHCTFLAPATLHLSFVVSDSHGERAESNSLAYSVFSDPVFGPNPVANPNPVTVDHPVAFYENVTGGSGGFTFHWQGLPSGCLSVDASVDTCVPIQTGTFSINLTATDSDGENATSPAWAEQVIPATGAPTPWGILGTFLNSYGFLGGFVALLIGAVLVVGYLARKRPPNRPAVQPRPPAERPPPS